MQVVQAADASTESGINIYVVPAITDEKILPTTSISNSYISNEISIVGCPGEYEPVSFVINASDDINSLQLVITNLIGEHTSISSNYVDIRIVKCWYQASSISVWVGDNKQKFLTPELLLKDDSLVRIENEENYLKINTGEYVLISDPTITAERIITTIEELPVQDSAVLQPVTIPAGTNKQFWLTLNIPDDALAGIYIGKIELRSGGIVISEIDLTLEVLPIELSQPYLEYSMSYRGKLSSNWPSGSISSEYKSTEQMLLELQNILEHGVANPNVYQGPYDETFLPVVLAMRDEIGIGGQPLYILGPGGLASDYVIERVMQLSYDYGISEVYFYGIDETQNVDSMRDFCDRVHAAGGKVFTSINNLSAGEQLADVLDLCLSTPGIAEALIPLYHSFGNKVYSYANPQVGVEKPETYRRNYGLQLWQNGYDGAMNYAYQDNYGTVWNDYDGSRYRDHNFTYPTIDGVIDTIQWEGWREGVDDIRYLSTLLNAIEIAKTEGIDTSTAEYWLTGLQNSILTSQDLNVIRSEMIDHILSLQNQLSNQSNVLTPVANESFKDWDVNSDGSTNVLDTILVGQYWGETGTAGWIRSDVNKDGNVNVLDMIIIGQHWTG